MQHAGYTCRRQGYPKELQGAEQPHSRESFGRAQPITGLYYFVSRCVGTKMISGQHIVGYLIRWQREITASLTAAKLKHAQCCI